MLWCAYGALLWCAPQALSSPGALKRLAWAVFLLGLVVALIGIVQMGHGNAAVYGFRPVRYGRIPFGPYFNDNHAASLMTMSALMGCGIFASRLPRLSTEAGDGRLPDLIAVQALILSMVSIIGYGIYLTGSRGAFHSLAAAAWLTAFRMAGFLAERRRRLALRWGLALAAAAYGAFLFVSPRWAGLTQGAWDASTSHRLGMYRSGLPILGDFPIFGVGLGALVGASPAYKERSVEGILDHVHNDWLELALQTGIAGFAVYVGSLVLFARRIDRAWAETPSRAQKGLMAGGVAAALAFVLHGLVDFSFQIPANAVVFFAILSWLGVCSRPEGAREREGTATAVPLPLAAAGTLILMLLAARPAVASWYAHRASAQASAGASEFLARAYRWDPNPAYLHQMAQATLKMSEESPEGREGLLREALRHTAASLRADPVNRGFGDLHAIILWRLERFADAQPPAYRRARGDRGIPPSSGGVARRAHPRLGT